MEEQKALKNKFIKLIIYNIIGFITIFLICGLFIFITVRNITYRSVDKELYESREKILEFDASKINILIEPEIFLYIQNRDELENTVKKYKDYIISKEIVNPNIIVILRDANGNIINESELGKINEYSDKITFNKKNMDKIYELSLGENQYIYRGINFVFEGNDNYESRYVQLLINVDSEQVLVKNYFQIISMYIIIGIVLSIFASYILSKKTLKTIQENLTKQMEFVQNASHELRTPLTIIQAKQELLLQEPNAKIIDKSEDIILTLNETKRLSKLVKDLMILSRADSNKSSLQKENINIDEYIKSIISPYSEIAEMQEKEIKLDLNYKLDIDVDTSKIYQLMIILLDNAIKYTEPKDTIEIKTYQKDNKCVIDVIDTGIGISDDGLKRIFERFYREDRARNRETGGSGLGLSIASFIVSEHGGTIKASHNTPKGTIFTIKLPK